MITRLSIVIISWNTLHRLRPCLEAMSDVLNRQDVELIWVDNGSTDGAAEFMAKTYQDSKRILLEKNRGVAVARNRGIEQANGEYVLLLDDDTIPSAEAIDRMMQHLDTTPTAGLCAVALKSPEGDLQDSFKAFPSPLVKLRNVIAARIGKKRETKLPEGIIHPVYVIGACQMFRRKIIGNVGLLDEAIFFGPEDADFCLRISKAGYTIDYLPDAHIIHHWRRMTTRSLTNKTSRMHIRALLHFYVKQRRVF